MRDKRFVAEHRGGPLKKEQHKQLIKWACVCAEHVLLLAGNPLNERLKKVLLVADEWQEGKTRVGNARKASVDAIAVANESSDSASTAVARAVGHAVATAHMADHSLRAADYALKALKDAGKPVDSEIEWQHKQLPSAIAELVLTARAERKELIKR